MPKWAQMDWTNISHNTQVQDKKWPQTESKISKNGIKTSSRRPKTVSNSLR